ncbi:MAG: biotin/lipoyl-containing protein, partial [Roseovarius gahaiensis]
MATEILMPALSPTMEEGTLAKWLVKEGDEVSSGDIIAEIETDKATMEFEAVDEGTIGKILIEEGAEGVKVNTPIAVLLEEGESADDIDSATSNAPAPQADDGDDADSSPKAAPATAKAPDAPKPDQSPDWPEGTETKKQTVREAINAAIAEEMRGDQTVFIMGEEVAEYEGAYKITQGLLDEFGAKRVIDTPI